jgi:predicted transcriptional regulator
MSVALVGPAREYGGQLLLADSHCTNLIVSAREIQSGRKFKGDIQNIPMKVQMRALSIRQPYAELILRGIKTAEVRSRATRIVGERFYIYASKSHSSLVTGHLSGTKTAAWSNDLTVAGDATPALLLELWEMLRRGELPTGVIVGSAVIEKVSRVDHVFRWHLAHVERAKKLRKPKGHPQPVWFKPF